MTLLNIFARLKSWGLMALSVLAVLLGVYAAGGRAAKKSTMLDQERTRRKAQEKINAEDVKVSKMDDDTVRRELAGFVRKR